MGEGHWCRMVCCTLLLILGILVMDGLCSTLNLEVSIQNGNTTEINNRAGLDTYTADVCTWSGTAPICEGQCPANTITLATSICGDGAVCIIDGEKKLCCNQDIY